MRLIAKPAAKKRSQAIVSAPLVIALVVGSTMPVITRAAVAESYLFDVLEQPGYLKSWDALLAGKSHVAPWLANYAKTRNGATTPAVTLALVEGRYQLHSVCKAHDCGSNRFYVLFAPHGKNAWGLLLTKGRAEQFFGNPDDRKKEMLRRAAKE